MPIRPLQCLLRDDRVMETVEEEGVTTEWVTQKQPAVIFLVRQKLCRLIFNTTTDLHKHTHAQTCTHCIHSYNFECLTM